ncbi:hypothetical protein HMH01_15820 [Halovulum dunhuangense]|uniref:Uncharacterized protein n=1 Tax=Halovulum dunhuangense TaxID=1505036 RepID=A0A849L658_9RHOB|nr:hypothetical protein [Halovulum dunhuangense]NNU81905.1 hypothetical protein [Halovulum dunhuangense]
MSGYLMKAAGAEAEACIDWRQGYLEPGEYVDADLGWSIMPAGDLGDPVIACQSFDDRASHARVRSGVPGRFYMLCARAATNTGRMLERAIVLRIAA